VIPEDIGYVHAQSIAILNGEINAEDLAIPLDSMLATLRQELLQFIPQESISRLTQMIIKYFTGLETS